MMHYPAPLNENNASYVKKELEKRDLKLASCDVEFSSPSFPRA